MTFDINRIYTAVNAEELHAGDVVYCSDNLYELRLQVEDEDIETKYTIKRIMADYYAFRFDVGENEDFALAYLVRKTNERV